MLAQADLGLALPSPAVSPEEIEQLVTVLREGPLDEERKASHRGWMTAGEIAPRIPDTCERQVRKIASAAAPVVVSYPGSPGYKLWQLCTVEEIDHAINAFEAQARDMIKRAQLYRQAYHRRFRGQPQLESPRV